MNIARRERVRNVRSLWPRESDFSDWLATDAGVALLADDVGIEVEDPTREGRPGDFPCDIVGRLLGDEKHVVVIENQFERTNHDHLGKFLTYASVHRAMTGIWIAEEAADDHRQVIDWLNTNTPDTVNLYLAELRAYRIGASDPAPQLDVVCRPNAATKAEDPSASPADRARHAWRLAFWTDIHEAVMASNPSFRLQKPGNEHWSSVSLGRSRFHVNMLLIPRTKRVGIDLYMEPVGWKDEAFEQMAAQREAIESEVREPLEWMPLPGKKSARVLLTRELDPGDPANRQAVYRCFAEKLPDMYAAFRPRVAALVAPDTDA